MPRLRPRLSITLPKNFTFNPNNDQIPATPESKPPLSPPPRPEAERPYRLKRRSRPTVTALFTDGPSSLPTSDTPLQSVECTVAKPIPQTLTYAGSLGTAVGLSAVQVENRSPHTPEPRRQPLLSCIKDTPDLDEGIARPLSRCSILSDSSENSIGSMVSYPAGDGSCTSPESEAPAFRFPSVRKRKVGDMLSILRKGEDVENPHFSRADPTKWTPEMDQHLWSTYLRYLQDPTVTPFKMLPGSAPPLGVCHRVAREAKKSWYSGRPSQRFPSPLLRSPSLSISLQGGKGHLEAFDPTQNIHKPDGGSLTLAGQSLNGTLQTWPKSGSSTRRRLRHLCRVKPSIAPHYQRLLQSRSPSPFSSSPRFLSRSQSHSSEASSLPGTAKAAFNTRNIQLSLTTSTADTMQPGGPLAKLAANEGTLPDCKTERMDNFNEPPVPFASEVTTPSDIIGQVNDDTLQESSKFSGTPRLGSPFGFHTWGPSQSRQRLRPRMQRTPTGETGPSPSSLRSPLQLQSFSNHPTLHKRRARCQLGEDLSPESNNFSNPSDNPFRTAIDRHHRRIRSRGSSLNDLMHHPLQSLFDAPPSDSSYRFDIETSVEAPSRFHSNVDVLESGAPRIEQAGPLNSPFSGFARSSRKTMRHFASLSQGVIETSFYSPSRQSFEDVMTTRGLDDRR